MKDFTERKIGKCLTEYKRNDFDNLVAKYNQFLMISQFDSTPQNVNDVYPNSSLFGPQLLDEPKCQIGYILFGVAEDGSLTKLIAKIDSSD